MLRHRVLFFGSALALAAGCGAADTGGSTATVACPPGSTLCTPAGATGLGTGGTGTTGAPVGSGPVMTGTGGAAGSNNGMQGAVGAAGANGGAVTPAVADGVPCDVAQVVSARCTGCHQTTPKFGAPMPLMTFADFHAPAHSNATRMVYQVIPERINPTDPAKRMPPTSVPALTAAENMTIAQWVAGGAMAAASSCPITAANLVPGDTPDGGTGTVSMGGSGGASIEPIQYDDPEMKCYDFLAHAAGDKNAPYTQAPGEQYMEFDFAAPWTGTVYQRATKLVIDPNSQVVHHWLLFKQSGPVTDGAVTPGTGVHPDGILLHGWAPGASPLYLDPDVGVKLESTVGYELEVHFNNPTGAPGDDHSGAELCVTPKVPAHVAQISWVGTDSISGLTASGTCSPNASEDIHIIAAQPHMHLKGNHMKVVINRAGGGMDVIHDEDFMFENQHYYVENAVLHPGDTMTTTCSYSSPATFGPSTNQEMCYFFSLAWPAGTLVMPGIGTALHGADSCL